MRYLKTFRLFLNTVTVLTHKLAVSIYSNFKDVLFVR